MLNSHNTNGDMQTSLAELKGVYPAHGVLPVLSSPHGQIACHGCTIHPNTVVRTNKNKHPTRYTQTTPRQRHVTALLSNHSTMTYNCSAHPFDAHQQISTPCPPSCRHIITKCIIHTQHTTQTHARTHARTHT